MTSPRTDLANDPIGSQNPSSVHSRTTVNVGPGMPEQFTLPSEKLGVSFQESIRARKSDGTLVSGDEAERWEGTRGGGGCACTEGTHGQTHAGVLVCEGGRAKPGWGLESRGLLQ